MRALILTLAVCAALAAAAAFTVDRWWLALGPSRVTAPAGKAGARRVRQVDLAQAGAWDILPRYVDLEVGDIVRVARPGAARLDLRVAAVEVESRAYDAPRTRVDLEVGGRTYAARCGMAEPGRGGIGPVEIEGVAVAVEVTRLVFSRMRGGTSPFNAWRNFRLRGDLRLAIWDAAVGPLRGIDGRFVLDQPEWTRGRLGNWLHSTPYGLHGAVDIFATRHGLPEPVRAPVDGVVYEIYNADASPDDTTRSKAINVYGLAPVGPGGERVLYRFQHLSEIRVSRGQQVIAGQVIGLTGHTGFDPQIGDHLHFEMRLNPSCFGYPRDDDIFATIPVNPYNYLLRWQEAEKGPMGRGTAPHTVRSGG